MKEERVLAIICIFYEANKLNRISLKDEPELWVALLNINNAKENCRPWFIADLLKIDEREWFKNKNLKIGGEVFEYQWIHNKTKEEWKGKS